MKKYGGNGKLPDYDGRLPGDPLYNPIGAQVLHEETTTGVPHEYHPKYGVVPVSVLADKRANVYIYGPNHHGSTLPDRLLRLARKTK